MSMVFQLNGIRVKGILSIDALKIPKNKITAIIGESGSGKTTLLKLLNHFITPDEGILLYQGTDIKTMNPIELRRKVVMLGQVSVVFPGSLRDNLQSALNFSQKPPMNDEELKAFLTMVHLNKTLDDSAEKMSGGEKQRLSLARVLILRPEILLLDEPSSSLDQETEELVIQKICHYVKENHKTLIMVTHSKAIAKKYGEHLIRIKDGYIEKEGDTNE